MPCIRDMEAGVSQTCFISIFPDEQINFFVYDAHFLFDDGFHISLISMHNLHGCWFHAC